MPLHIVFLTCLKTNLDKYSIVNSEPVVLKINKKRKKKKKKIIEFDFA